jgi:serine/threonine protein kinase
MSDEDPWINQVLAGYIILRRLGEGGMGVVYLARHQSLDRLAAVKFLPAEMASDASFVELFLREAKAAAKLAHPNIVDVHDAGVVGDNIYYFIMEYVEGHDLNSMLKDLGTVPPEQAIDYIRQAASALAYAHKKQIIHRDIKPENLLLTTEGVIKVVDLGLAKWAGEEQSMLTQTGDILGSPIYISPERLRDPHTNDPRSDIYSLGSTFYHLVTGKIPYEGSAPVIMARHLTDPVPDPREENPSLDDGLALIIMKMMAKDVRERFQTMDEVETALKEYRSGGKVTGQTSSPAGRNPWLAPAVLVVVAIGFAIILVSIFKKPEPTKAEIKTETAAPAIQPRPVPVPVVEPPKPVEPVKPVETPKPPRVVADFNTDSRMNKLGGTFGSWGSSRPQPVGKAGEEVKRSGGTDDSGFWKLDFDITNKGSFSGAWMKLNDLDVSDYDTFGFKARAEGVDSLNFAIELKGRSVGRHVVRDVGPQWKSIEIPIKDLRLTSTKGLSELTIVFSGETTGAKKGFLCIEDIEFIKKP